MIRITSKKDGFRRCGVAHPAAPTDHPNQAFTPEQLAVLGAEPMLVVQRLADPPTDTVKAQGAGYQKDQEEGTTDEGAPAPEGKEPPKKGRK